VASFCDDRDVIGKPQVIQPLPTRDLWSTGRQALSPLLAKLNCWMTGYPSVILFQLVGNPSIEDLPFTPS
jgi:hypothetical protein